MPFQPDSTKIEWKLHLASNREKVFEIISTDIGRNKFWALTKQDVNQITFHFPNGYIWTGKILVSEPPHRFSLQYIDDTHTTFLLEPDGQGGTELTLSDKGVADQHRNEVVAGWGSVLMSLKAAIDFGVDLRNHDESRTWDQGYFEN